MLFVVELLKTQSGKIIRRTVEAVYIGDNLGALSSIDNRAALEET